jgi:hypothetical protein
MQGLRGALPHQMRCFLTCLCRRMFLWRYSLSQKLTTIPLPTKLAEADNLKLRKLLACHKLPFRPRELPQMSQQSLPASVKVERFAPCHKGWPIPSLSATSMVLQACTTWPMCPQRTSTRPLMTYSMINTWIFKSA